MRGMGPDSTFTLARDRRLRKRRDFLRVQKYGHRIFGRHIVVISQRTKDPDVGRLGITVPKKVGPAHERNLVKRRIRHILRLNKSFFSKANIVVIARESANGLNFAALSEDVLDACRKITTQGRTFSRHKHAPQKYAAQGNPS